MSVAASDFIDVLRPRLMAPDAAHYAPRFRMGFGAEERFLDVDGDGKAFRPAAVLVPVVDRPAGGTVLLTQRCTHLADHGGQISFPGGRLEEGDDGPVDAALREAREEVGLMPGNVRAIVGALDARGTVSNYRVTPVIALVAPFTPVLQADEVAEAFEVPLDHVLDPDNHESMHVSPADGQPRQMYAIRHGRHFIFGFTARILVQLSEIWHRGHYRPDQNVFGAGKPGAGDKGA
ncbi:MAG: CoA pyrophosphatase [Trueperaceae bacterium]